MKPELTQKITFEEFEDCIKQGVEQAMKECELTIGMTLKEAVEKQIPQKVKAEKYKYGKTYHCPNCNIFVGYNDDLSLPKYCNCCGQALDWGE